METREVLSFSIYLPLCSLGSDIIPLHTFWEIIKAMRAQECSYFFTPSTHSLATKADDCLSGHIPLCPLPPSELSFQTVNALKIFLCWDISVSLSLALYLHLELSMGSLSYSEGLSGPYIWAVQLVQDPWDPLICVSPTVTSSLSMSSPAAFQPILQRSVCPLGWVLSIPADAYVEPLHIYKIIRCSLASLDKHHYHPEFISLSPGVLSLNPILNLILRIL
jgi:hypothetical protein